MKARLLWIPCERKRDPYSASSSVQCWVPLKVTKFLAPESVRKWGLLLETPWVEMWTRMLGHTLVFSKVKKLETYLENKLVFSKDELWGD